MLKWCDKYKVLVHTEGWRGMPFESELVHVLHPALEIGRVAPNIWD